MGEDIFENSLEEVLGDSKDLKSSRGWDEKRQQNVKIDQKEKNGSCIWPWSDAGS